MDMYDKIFERYETKGTFAVLVRTVLQHLMPADKLDQVFEESRNRQYHRMLAFSTCMEILCRV
jgi:predicted nucleotidyltransferase